MDYTPYSQNISEDSGCLTLTTSETSSSINSGVSSLSHYIETPTTTLNASRKRKIPQYDRNAIRNNDLESSHYESPYESPAIFQNCNPSFLSSTLNESLSKSLEKCNLKNYTPNFYVERSSCEFDNELSLKRYKLDESPKYQPKTRSAPSTPTKHLETDVISEKARSEHLTNCYYTPDRNSITHTSEKLGTSERLALLYPRIQPTITPTKLKTPEKLREFIKKINSPAKKRLFENSQIEKKSFKRVERDPVILFTVKNDLRHILSEIFEYLSDGDLCTVSKVSKIWRRALNSDHKAFPRYYTYSREYNSNKENILVESVWGYKSPSPPGSPERDNFQRCTRIASKLSPSQSLQKCLRCMEPAVIQKSISQCQNPNCEYIYCTICLSFSTTGPENFIDKCQTSELILNNKPNTPRRFSLYDISNETIPSASFLFNNSLDAFQSKYDSSGYLSESDMSPIVKRNVSLNMETKPLQPLTLNRVDSTTRRKSRRSSLVSVISSRTTPKIVELTEPSSPPKIKTVAGSKQSKKNLKRLHF